MTLHLNICTQTIDRLFKSLFLATAVGLVSASLAWSQQPSWSRQIAASTMQHWPQGHLAPSNEKETQPRDLGMLLLGMDSVWYNNADGSSYQYVKQAVDNLIAQDGSISIGSPEVHSPEAPILGQQLLLLYRVTREEKYYKAASLLRAQLTAEPERLAGNFWMPEPFYAEYAALFHQPQDFAGITTQFALAEKHLGLSASGSGKPPHSPAPELGLYMMAVVDSLPYYPKDDPGRATLLAILKHTAASAAGPHQTFKKPIKHDHDSDLSTACIFTYAIAKGIRLGYLPQSSFALIEGTWQDILNRSSLADADAFVTQNHPSTIGAFLLAASEMDVRPTANLGRSKTILLDAWFNSQQRSNAAGQQEYFHYKWDDYSDSGFSLLGHIFESYGAKLDTLSTAPTAALLEKAQYYLIASPDIPAKNPHPNYVQPADAVQIAEWVNHGGILILMENDPANADIDHLNRIVDSFGIHFNNTLSHHVIGNDFAPGTISVSGDGPIFHAPQVLYMKDTCTISLKPPATSLLTDKGDIMMAIAKYGKGEVVAVVDPWLYNEYTDHRKLQPAQDNFAAGREWVRWLLSLNQHE